MQGNVEKIDLNLSATNIRYILVIHQLEQSHKFVKCTDIANILSVSRPSVHAMIKTLRGMEIITKPHYGKVNFTLSGKQLAEDYSKYFDVLHAHFSKLFPQETDISNAVCAFMSQLSVQRLSAACDVIAA